MAEAKKKMSSQDAEELFQDILCSGPPAALNEIRKTACARRLTPVQALAEIGDPREEVRS